MGINEYLNTHTHRQHNTWIEFLGQSYDVPDKIDYYLMQIASEVRRTIAKNPSQVHLDQFRLRFHSTADESITLEQAAAYSKAKWFGFLGVKQGKES